MHYTKFLLILIVLVNNSKAMEISPLWEKIRKDALDCARNNQTDCTKDFNRSIRKVRCSILGEYYQKVNEAQTINDIVSLIQEQALFAMRLPQNYTNKIMLQRILFKACPGITTNNMNFCLKNLELLFTGKTTNYDAIVKKMTLTAVQLLLKENMEGNNSFYNAEQLP